MTDTVSTVSSNTLPITIKLLDLVFPPPRSFDIRLWDGQTFPAGSQAEYTLVLRHPGALRRMFSPPIERSMGESYIYGDFDVEGDILKAVELGDSLFGRVFSPGELLQLVSGLLQLPAGGMERPEGRGAVHLKGSRHTQARDLKAVQYHYDVGNDFYALWLGKRMVYSCAYFQDWSEDLDTAQARKLEHICRKLRLAPGERLLDIGCGWGGLILHAAQQHGVRALGVTLSQEQHRYVSQKIQELGLGEKVEVRLQDYRQVADGPFDKIASVGMVEHVGRKRMPDYFSQAFRLLKPGGMFLNHGISCLPEPSRSAWDSLVYHLVLGPHSFDDKYFFPDGELQPVSELNLFAERAGLEVRDVENLREHYAMTLRHWVTNMEANRAEMVRVTNEVTYRTWRLYMAFVAHSFNASMLSINQSLLAKPDHGKVPLPNTRADIYR